MKRSRWFTGLVLIWLIFVMRAENSTVFSAQADQSGTPEAESKEEKKLRERQEKLAKEEEQRKEKEAKNKIKEARKYSTLKEFAEDQYATEPQFRDEVDQEYRNLQGRHAMDAYRINTSQNKEILESEDDSQIPKIRRVLYDNPWVQEYVNGVGQRLVPDDSEKLYAFKVTFHPIPYAYTLSTGTVLISTGMIALLENEAQLAYVLGHELAHVYKDHWKIKAMMPLAEEEYNKRQEKKRALWTGIFAAAGAGIGAAARGGQGAIVGATTGALAGYVIGSLYARQIGLDWDTAQENEADELGLKLALEKSYDVQEVPRLYAAMQQVARVDERVQLGFLGSRNRIRERSEYAQKLLQGSLQPKYQELLKAAKLVGTRPDFNLIMAELKRDNGIEAFRFDMLQMARQNLQQAVSLRSDDALSAYYYGRIMKLVARNQEEKNIANQSLLTAIRLDDIRQNLPEAHLHRALLLMDSKEQTAQSEATQALQAYILSFQRKKVDFVRNDNTLPPNVDVLYDFMRLLGEKSWKAPPPELVHLSATAQGVAASAVVQDDSHPVTAQPTKTQSTGTKKK
jgi:predicted Zn-dependent protease